MKQDIKRKGGPHRRMWGAAERVEEERVDELLELIWTLREKGVSDLNQLLETTPDMEAKSILRLMIKDDLFRVEDNRVVLKDRGEEKAREIIRRHRLTERLLSEIFEMSEEEVEEEACKLEHILSPGVTESVCTFLGHPPTCIHGKPIPRGACCAKFKKEMKLLVIPLDELGLGEEGRIVFIAPKSHRRLDRLSTLGIVPGSTRPNAPKEPIPCLADRRNDPRS
jgi:DtxR family Mn-dependent transcriptional regulator